MYDIFVNNVGIWMFGLVNIEFLMVHLGNRVVYFVFQMVYLVL